MIALADSVIYPTGSLNGYVNHRKEWEFLEINPLFKSRDRTSEDSLSPFPGEKEGVKWESDLGKRKR